MLIYNRPSITVIIPPVNVLVIKSKISYNFRGVFNPDLAAIVRKIRRRIKKAVYPLIPPPLMQRIRSKSSVNLPGMAMQNDTKSSYINKNSDWKGSQPHIKTDHWYSCSRILPAVYIVQTGVNIFVLLLWDYNY